MNPKLIEVILSFVLNWNMWFIYFSGNLVTSSFVFCLIGLHFNFVANGGSIFHLDWQACGWIWMREFAGRWIKAMSLSECSQLLKVFTQASLLTVREETSTECSERTGDWNPEAPKWAENKSRVTQNGVYSRSIYFGFGHICLCVTSAQGVGGMQNNQEEMPRLTRISAGTPGFPSKLSSLL